MMPSPKAMASQGTSRPGPTSASAHARSRSPIGRDRPATSGHAHVGLPAPADRHVASLPRVIPRSTTAPTPTPPHPRPAWYTARGGRAGAFHEIHTRELQEEVQAVFALETFAHVSRSPTVRLKTSLPGFESGSGQK